MLIHPSQPPLLWLHPCDLTMRADGGRAARVVGVWRWASQLACLHVRVCAFPVRGSVSLRPCKVAISLNCLHSAPLYVDAADILVVDPYAAMRAVTPQRVIEAVGCNAPVSGSISH